MIIITSLFTNFETLLKTAYEAISYLSVEVKMIPNFFIAVECSSENLRNEIPNISGLVVLKSNRNTQI